MNRVLCSHHTDSEKPLGKSDHGDDAGAVADESPAAVVVQSGEAGESADGEEKPTVTPDEAADQDSDHVPIAESHPELTSPDAAGKSADTPSDTTAESAEAGAIDSSPEVATDSAPDGAAASVQEVAADSALEVAADEGSASQDDPAVSTEPGEAAAEPLPESAADATASPQDIAEGGAVVPEQDSGGAGEAAVTDEASVTGGGAAAEEAGTPYDPPTEEAGNEPDAPITEEPAQPSTDVDIPEKPDDENITVMDAALETDNAGAGEQPVLRAEDGPADSVAADEPAAAVDDDVPPMPQEEPAEDTAVTDGASTVQLDEGSKHGPPEEGQDATADAVSDQPLSTESAMDEGGKMEADTPEIPTEAATEVIVQEDMPEAANAATTADSAAPEVDPTPEATTETLPAVVATTENAPIVGDVDAETPTQADACEMETHADLEVMSIACMEGDSAASSPIAAVHSNDNTCGTKERAYGKTETMRGVVCDFGTCRTISGRLPRMRFIMPSLD